MGKVRRVAQWWPVGILMILAALAVLDITGSLGPVYRWMVRYMPPEVWSAIAAWVAVAVGIVTVLVAGRYAKQQVAKAQEQIDEARRTREEQAQPNVVMYAEPNAVDWQLLEVVIKNFGTTPAYDIVPIVDPPLQSLPNMISDGKNYEIPIPVSIPILAPGQEWRTFWDSAVERREKERDIQAEIIGSWQGGPPTGTDFAPLVSERMPKAKHNVKVQYWDSQKKMHVTLGFLDFDMLKGSIRPKHYGVHDIAKKYVERG
ncbi:hypothetical protein [Mycobacterium deserti]|uniref:Uncharacterized protein n=1 Tax=Mycobacterium deserti TaxID=2978347 RepID=A0ABT2M5B1_9MYCO|nr:hypothetical protein [Mycobacterium deserti]MCT7656829.1 hypothetical protein [Mycobacterium deserti]